MDSCRRGFVYVFVPSCIDSAHASSATGRYIQQSSCSSACGSSRLSVRPPTALQPASHSQQLLAIPATGLNEYCSGSRRTSPLPRH
eukprot:scaffold292461_cov43-Prasinocladus_malaysianus.AAC.1